LWLGIEGKQALKGMGYTSRIVLSEYGFTSVEKVVMRSKVVDVTSVNSLVPDLVLDARGLACPLPLLKAKKALREIAVGQTLQVLSTDAGSWRDFAVFAEQAGHVLLEAVEVDQQYHYLLLKQV
jgi:tRNA 2-thiouridine synthesizing protein A